MSGINGTATGHYVCDNKKKFPMSGINSTATGHYVCDNKKKFLCPV